MAAPKPTWLRKALTYLGEKEIKGPVNSPIITGWWQKIRAPWFNDDETPWCAAFVGGVLEECDIVSTRNAAARSYQQWGANIPGPCVGAIAVLWRGTPDSPSGHVAFVVGKDQAENLMLLGGNQGDEVSIKPFAKQRALSYHWPRSNDLPRNFGFQFLPVVESNGEISINEG